MAVRPRSRWSDRSSTAWIAYSPFAEIRTPSAHSIRIGRFRFARQGHGSAHAATFQDARGVAGEVGDHDIGARAPDGRERLHHRALLVEPAEAKIGRASCRERVEAQ